MVLETDDQAGISVAGTSLLDVDDLGFAIRGCSTFVRAPIP
jgi:hypothetical protein